MKKLLCCAVAAALLSGSASGFAAKSTYTDLDSGFRLKTEAPWLKLGGKDFYGLTHKGEGKDMVLNLVCSVPADKVEAAIGEKFTTEQFFQKFKELQLLERNEISPEKVEYALFKPETYEIPQDDSEGNPAFRLPEKKDLSGADEENSMLNATDKNSADTKTALSVAGEAGQANAPDRAALALLPKGMLKNASVGISTGKRKNVPYVYLHFVDKGERDSLPDGSLRPMDIQLAITSQNDRLYTVLSAFPLPDLKKQKSRVEEATPFSQEKIRTKINEGNKSEFKSHMALREDFLKGLTYFAPVKDTQPFGFDDALSGRRIALPDRWAYFQASKEDRENHGSLHVTFSVPWPGIAALMRNGQETTRSGEMVPPIPSIGQGQTKINEALLFASARTDKKDEMAQFFAEPLLSGFVVERLIKSVLDNPKVKEVIDFKDYKTSADFTSDFGTVKLNGNGILYSKNGSVKEEMPFRLNLRAAFTRQDVRMASYFTRDKNEFTSELKNIDAILDSIKLPALKK